jgi:hypothetical protein
MTFTPDRSSITNITQAIPAVVTTSKPHGLFTGNVVRLNVPKTYGMFQLNNIAVQVSVLTNTTFACYYSLPPPVPVDSRNYPAFVTPTNPGFVSSVIPIGSGITPQNNVPWQSQNNYCDTPLTDAVLNNSTVEIPY